MTGGKGASTMRHSFLYFVGTHFEVLVRKLLVNLRTLYASPQKLAQPLVRFSSSNAWTYDGKSFVKVQISALRLYI